ncbi:alpha/beta fold hydrolase [Sphingopyxis sp. OPL5]|uniref:PHA/PHB synthase family protein n=1 Tax=Sphingopyxis sp. OPL5 TaxID=2486273 RepID=UPI00164E9A52|nr:alpha/beta fold hydrolase [Sphingopyxis sp. OPL5]QNO27953.1 alpha/beta fold hydrolase [Sphingopyxis sp. OPL5]
MTEAKNENDRSGAWGWPPFVPEQFLSYWPVGWKAEPWMAAGADFLKEMTSIAAGTSALAPDSKDWRFKDKAWSENPLYQRWAQAYLAMCTAVEAMIPDNIPCKERARAEMVTSIVTSMFAPTNTLVGNPAALAKTWDTKGDNLAKGFQNFLRDLGENGGMPAQVDDSGFEVGRNLAVTPGKIVLRTPMFELIHYAAATDKVSAVPVLLVPPQIGRYYFTDLAPGRSFAEYTVSQGINYFAISWRNPSPSEREWGLDDYLEAAFEAVEAVAEIAGVPKINIVGFCAGGILSAILAAWLEARKISLINSLTLCVTMLDFSSDAALGAFRFPAMLSVAKAQSELKGVLPGDDLHKVFTLMRPNDLLWNYWVNNYLMGDSPPAFDILAWNKDGTNMPARLHRDFLELFETNPLIEPGRFKIADEAVDLGRIGCDAFVVGAVTDHLTPWKACYKAVHLLGGEAMFALSNGGHIAALVNPPGNPKAWHKLAPATAPDADGWEAAAVTMPGSWWESWTKWIADRSGKAVKAPGSPGSAKHKPIADAPGQYVKESPAL